MPFEITTLPMSVGSATALQRAVENAHPGWYGFMMNIGHNKTVVAQFDELGNRGGDLATLYTLCTPDMVNHALAAGRPQGIAFAKLGRNESGIPATEGWKERVKAMPRRGAAPPPSAYRAAGLSVFGVQSMTAPPVKLISLAVIVRAQSDAAKVAMLATSS
jgi:hypothetical protein